MIDFTKEQIRKAAEIIKIIRLSNTPIMNAAAAFKLNQKPTDDEVWEAERWARALGLATTNATTGQAAAVIITEGSP